MKFPRKLLEISIDMRRKLIQKVFSISSKFVLIFLRIFNFFFSNFFSKCYQVFSDVSERNNDYSCILDFRKGWVEKAVVVTFFVFEVPDYKFAMLMYLYFIYIFMHVYKRTIQVAVLNRFSWNSHGWCGSTHGWILLFLEIIGPVESQIWGKMCPQNQFSWFKSDGMVFFEEKT